MRRYGARTHAPGQLDVRSSSLTVLPFAGRLDARSGVRWSFDQRVKREAGEAIFESGAAPATVSRVAESRCHCAAKRGKAARQGVCPLTSPYTDLQRGQISDECTAGAWRWSDVEVTSGNGESRRVLYLSFLERDAYGRRGVRQALLAVRCQPALFAVAVQFLTRLPMPPMPGYRAEWLSSSVRYFPLVGVLVGIINVGVWWLAGRWLPTAVSVGVMLAASLLVTGAFHEDGFADSCDGFGGGTTAARVLEIMKDSRLGAYGAIGIVIMLGLKWSTLVALPAPDFPLTVVSAHMVSRWCAAGLMWRLPYVRFEGDAKSRLFAGGQSAAAWLSSGAIGAAAIACLTMLPRFSAGISVMQALSAAALVAAVTAAAAAVYCRRRIGGYTGDCLGAVQQLSELGFLLTGLAVLNPIEHAA